jgi:Flp pilus assembly protein TadG
MMWKLRTKHSRSRNQRGASLVEFALVLFGLCVILFGIVEFGLVFRDKGTIAQAAREAARSLSVGSSPTVAVNRAISASTGVTLTSSNIVLDYQTPDSSGNVTTTGWTTMTNTATTNPANPGDFVRATITYTHTYITHFSFVGGGGTQPLHGSVIMRKE